MSCGSTARGLKIFFPPECLLCGSQGRDREQGAESVYPPYQNRLTQNIYHTRQRLISYGSQFEESFACQCHAIKPYNPVYLMAMYCWDLIAGVVTHRGPGLIFSSVHRLSTSYTICPDYNYRLYLCLIRWHGTTGG